MNAEKELKKNNVIVENFLNRYFSKKEFLPMKDLLDYSLLYTDPDYDRAYLVRLAGELFGQKLKRLLPAMAAYELFNISLLVTDDFFDKREGMRMNKVPIYKKWSSKISVALGFYLNTIAFEIILNSYYKVGKVDIKEIIRVLNWTAKWQYYSQKQEDYLASKNISEVKLDDYFDLIKNATAIGTAAAFEIGSIIANANSKQRKQFRDFGFSFGYLLQIRDDLIDYIKKDDIIMKSPLNDLKEKRMRLPLLVCYWESDEKTQTKISRILNRAKLKEDDINYVYEILLSEDIKKRYKKIAEKIFSRSKHQLNRLPCYDEKSKKLLNEMLSTLANV